MFIDQNSKSVPDSAVKFINQVAAERNAEVLFQNQTNTEQVRETLEQQTKRLYQQDPTNLLFWMVNATQRCGWPEFIDQYTRESVSTLHATLVNVAAQDVRSMTSKHLFYFLYADAKDTSANALSPEIRAQVDHYTPSPSTDSDRQWFDNQRATLPQPTHLTTSSQSQSTLISHRFLAEEENYILAATRLTQITHFMTDDERHNFLTGVAGQDNDLQYDIPDSGMSNSQIVATALSLGSRNPDNSFLPDLLFTITRNLPKDAPAQLKNLAGQFNQLNNRS